MLLLRPGKATLTGCFRPPQLRRSAEPLPTCWHARRRVLLCCQWRPGRPGAPWFDRVARGQPSYPTRGRLDPRRPASVCPDGTVISSAGAWFTPSVLTAGLACSLAAPLSHLRDRESTRSELLGRRAWEPRMHNVAAFDTQAFLGEVARPFFWESWFVPRCPNFTSCHEGRGDLDRYVGAICNLFVYAASATRQRLARRPPPVLQLACRGGFSGYRLFPDQGALRDYRRPQRPSR